MNRSSDFNYKVALASGLRSLQGGRLRQAEEQFRYLIAHFPSADGGYRGLAKVLVEQEDGPAALHALLEGGAALAKAGERASAIAMYRDAVLLDPHDLAAHRRLAAALALSGDDDAAAAEYERYVRGSLDAGDPERARLESAYALERMPDNARIAELGRAHAGGVTPDAGVVEATAARYLARRDPRAASAALDAARRYIADGRIDAASDLLLQLIAGGIAEHEAQRLLVAVARHLGKRDVATAKVQLLVQALRLDGRDELAAEVEQLARVS